MEDRALKVAYVLTPITFGGSEKVSLTFLRHLDRRRLEIHPILLTRPWEPEPFFAQELRSMGFAYQTLPIALEGRKDPFRVLRVLKRLYQIIGQEGFDLVHTHGYFADLCGLPAAALSGVPSLSTCHGFIGIDRKLRLYYTLDKFGLRLCHTVIAVSQAIKEELMRSGLADSRITILPNAVSVKRPPPELAACRREVRRELRIEEDELVIGYAGRLSAEKGVAYLIEAAALGRRSLPLKVLVVGEGPDRKLLEQTAAAQGLAGSVLFAGFRTDIEKWLAAMDIFVLPSLTEGTPMALLEAMAAGIPPVATRVGGVPKVLTDQVDGVLVPPGSVQALSSAIERLGKDPLLRARIGGAGRQTIARSYAVADWCQAILRLYNRAAESTSAAGRFSAISQRIVPKKVM